MRYANLAFVALIVEGLIGYPKWFEKKVPHPVNYVAQLIHALDKKWNTGVEGKKFGGYLVAALIVAAIVLGNILHLITDQLGLIGYIALVLIATTGLAQLSLDKHVGAVFKEVKANNLERARAEVSKIVGRDTSDLTMTEVIGAALESLSESFNDGVVAPAFWLIVGGLPGLFAYKAINTADSLIGHKNEKYKDFGWAAARTDDVMNFIPARIAGLLITLGARAGFKVMKRDAKKHESPNAGWPEAAMAGALGIKLGGPAIYNGVRVDRPIFGDGQFPTVKDFKRGIKYSHRAHMLLWVLAFLIAFI